MSELEILNMNVGGMTIKDMSALSFLQWVAKKLNGIKAYTSTANELTMLISNPPMTRSMGDDAKLVIIRKMQNLKLLPETMSEATNVIEGPIDRNTA